MRGTQLGKVGHDGEGVPRLHQGEEHLLALAENDLLRGLGGDDLPLQGEHRRGTQRGPTGGNEATLFQLLHRHRLALGQGVVLPADKHHWTAQQLPIDAILRGGLLEGEQHLNIPFGEQIVQGAQGNQANHGQNPLLLLAQPLQSRAQQPQVRCAAAPQPQAHGPGLIAPLHPHPGDVGQLENFPRILQKHMPFLGQAHLFAGALEQRHPQLVLQGLHLVADSGLSQAQVLGRPGEVEIVGHRQKALQLRGVHERFPPNPYNNKSLL